tara:strand:- start:1024 stop:1422 length:399 start_codon:yes stop_codon:yes gene_type:complete
MPTYDFKCRLCGTVQEIFRRFSEKLPEKAKDLDTICCDKDACVYQIFSAPASHISGTKTIGSLAEQNSRRMGKDQVENLTEEYRTKKEDALSLKEGMKIKNSAPISTEKMKQINKINQMTTSQKKRYIEKGE